MLLTSLAEVMNCGVQGVDGIRSFELKFKYAVLQKKQIFGNVNGNEPEEVAKPMISQQERTSRWMNCMLRCNRNSKCQLQ